LQIDAIEQRSGDLRQIARDLVRRADALAPAMIEETAGAFLWCLFVI